MRIVDQLQEFLTSLDATGVRVVWVAFALFTIAGIVLAGGMLLLDIDQGAVSDFLRALRGQWWAVSALVATFVVLAFVGAPQVVLIAATVVVFGTSDGIVLAWIATMISASVGYLIGRVGGANAVRKLLGGRGGRALDFIGENGFLASMIIRMVPSGPFIVVNMALGAAKVPSMQFVGGSGIGIIPKIALVAFGGQGLGAALRGENLSAALFFVAAGIVWALIAFVVRPLLRNREALRGTLE